MHKIKKLKLENENSVSYTISEFEEEEEEEEEEDEEDDDNVKSIPNKLKSTKNIASKNFSCKKLIDPKISKKKKRRYKDDLDSGIDTLDQYTHAIIPSFKIYTKTNIASDLIHMDYLYSVVVDEFEPLD